jgi:hypothetical protein
VSSFHTFSRDLTTTTTSSSLQQKVGLVLGLIFVEPSNLPDIPGHLAVFLEDYDISLSLPQIDVSRVQVEWKRLISTIPEPWKLNTDGREFQVGDAIKARGLEAKYPVVLIPGVISTVYISFFCFWRGLGIFTN